VRRAQRRDDFGFVELQQGADIEDEAGKHAAGQTAGLFSLLNVFLIDELEPADALFPG
jgi:hypothetical protein